MTVKVTVGSQINTLGNHNDSVTALSSLNNYQIASAGLDKKIRSWDLNASVLACIFSTLIYSQNRSVVFCLCDCIFAINDSCGYISGKYCKDL